ncbi:50S ribosomal protein L4 [uncultured archaeon]|nr:50S ribosomal protein L4 [uncultured archaeon]
MKVEVFSIEGKATGSIELPKEFSAKVDTELIKRAVLAIQSAGVQAKAPYLMAGRNNTSVYVGSRSKPTVWRGINVEKARKPRLKNRRFLIAGQVAGIPGVVGGPRAHPPKIEKVWGEKINAKEKRKATVSAIAATAKPELVKARGHIVPEGMKLPLVVETKFEGLAKSSEVVEALGKLGIYADVERVKAKRTIRAGKGKKRGRVHRTGKSVLIVAADSSKIFLGARNLSGVEVVRARDINAEILAPGALCGRLTLWTEGALKAMAAGPKAN